MRWIRCASSRGRRGWRLGMVSFVVLFFFRIFFLVWFGLFSLIFFSRGMGEVLAFHIFHLFSDLFFRFLSVSCSDRAFWLVILTLCCACCCCRCHCTFVSSSAFIAPAFQFHRYPCVDDQATYPRMHPCINASRNPTNTSFSVRQ